ncbi:MAG: hypothetical protein INR65_20675, partial [Gluconacetobacter diazotrophicus]|nr:hypothetical protein [Gluconacetobacter diazotrophicus]
MTDFRHARRSAANPERGPTPRDDGDVAAVVSEAVGRLRANGHLYFELRRDEPSGIAVAVRHHRSEDVALVEYGERFYTDDPLTAPFRSWLSRGGTSGRGPGIVALGELPRASRTAYENRFLRRAGIADVLGIGIPASIDGRPRVFCFGFHRSAADPGFAAGEKRALARLADGLRLRAENLALREALALQAMAGRALAEDTGSG